MKKMIALVCMFLAICSVRADSKKLDLPGMAQWTKVKNAQFSCVDKEWWLLKNGTVQIPGKYPAKYGDCVLLSMRHKGKGRVRVRLLEYNAKGKLLAAWNYKTYLNGHGKEAVYAPTYDIMRKDTAYFQITVEASNNQAFVFKSLTAHHAFGPDQKLYSPVLALDHWNRVTKGENLAKGAKFTFDPEPNRAATKRGNTDATDLQDGKVSSRRGTIYDDPASVGWQHRILDRCAFTMDLGSPKAISSIVMRICGGRLNGTKGGSAGMFPELIEVWVSNDYVKWHKASSLQKLQVNERHDADWKTLYYLPESHGGSPAYVYPFKLSVQAKARYVHVKFKTAYYLFTMDEVVLLKGNEKDPDFNEAFKGAPAELMKKQAALSPHYPEFYVADNVNVPNFFRVDDNRDLIDNTQSVKLSWDGRKILPVAQIKDQKGSVSYIFDFPAQVKYIQEDPKTMFHPETRILTKTEKKGSRVRYHFRSTLNYGTFYRRAIYEIGPYYFRAEGKVPEKEKYMSLITFINGKEVGRKDMKLNILTIPKVPEMKHLILAGTWFTGRVMYSWPEMVRSMRHLGFNALSLHGRITPRNKAYLETIRKNKFKVIAVPDNMLMRKWSKLKEIHCTSWKKVPSHNHLCPMYRGKHYQELCDEVVGKTVKELVPDLVHLDYEFFFSPETFVTCTRCEAVRKSKKMSRKEFAEWAMADSYKNVLLAARKAAPKARIASYLYCADRMDECGPDMVSLFGAKRLYPKYLDELHTVHYGTNLRFVKRAVRTNYLYTRDPKRVLMYLSSGSGAYFNDEYGIVTYFSLLESYMNGAHGVAYFVDRSMNSPLDYYYSAKALALLAPFDEFLAKAPLIETFKGDNKDLTYSLRKMDKTGLLLVGNYSKRKDMSVFLPLKGLKSVEDRVTGKKVPFTKEGIRLNVKKYDVRLLKLTYR